MDNIWSWICELPYSDEWKTVEPPESSTQLLVYPLTTTSTKLINTKSAGSIQLRAERSYGVNSSSSDALFDVKFSVHLLGFQGRSEDEEDHQTTLWVSDTCHLSQDKPFLPLVMQLLQELISRSPAPHQGSSTCPRSQLQKLKPDPVAWILDSHSPESLSSFFNLIFLTRLFWLCCFDAPSEAGSFYFDALLAPNLETFSCRNTPILRTFFISVGTDIEICFMRTFGYMLAKWLILRDVGPGLQTLTPSQDYNIGFSYGMESHGLWILKGYAPVKAMKCTSFFNGQRDNLNHFCSVMGARESVLRYALAHQQLEAVIQLEYTVRFNDGFIQVNAHLDNIRLHVVKLGFHKNEEEEEDNLLAEERYFPSKIRIWVGPEVGAEYVGGMSLGRSTNDVERELETQRILKGDFGAKNAEVKAVARMGTRTKVKNWRWDQDAEGNAAVFDSILYDESTGVEVATWDPSKSNHGGGGGGGGQGGQLANNLRRRYSGANRGFTKRGGLVFAKREEFGEEGVRWRLKKEMEGSVLKWRIGGQVWLTYWPNEVNCSYYETRCIEWCDEVDLPLISLTTF